MNKKNPFEENKHEIKYNLINSFLAGLLVFLGSLTTGFSLIGLGVGLIAAFTTATLKFCNYWEKQANEYAFNPKILNFI